MESYCITIKESIPPELVSWFGPLEVIPGENGETLLITPGIDQAALRGLLDHFWNINLTILSIERKKDNP